MHIDVNSMYPSINKIWFEEVSDMTEPYLNRYTYEEKTRDIAFLYETDVWNGTKITDMTSAHIINAATMLIKRASEFKFNYELFIIDNKDNKLLVPRDNIDEISKMEPIVWVKTTPIFIALTKEMAVRKLLSYFETTLDRTGLKGE